MPPGLPGSGHAETVDLLAKIGDNHCASEFMILAFATVSNKSTNVREVGNEGQEAKNERIATLATERAIGELRSHVYKTNRLFIAFHRKPGFLVTREKDKGFEFFTTLEELATKPAVRQCHCPCDIPPGVRRKAGCARSY